MDYTPRVLRNQGVPIELAAVDDLDGRLFVRYSDDELVEGDPTAGVEKQQHFVKFTYSTIARIEEEWGSVPAWQLAIVQMPSRAVIKTLGFALGMPEEEVGIRMLPGHMPFYSDAIASAWALANGSDPFAIAKALQKAAPLNAAASHAPEIDVVGPAATTVDATGDS
jgi:hypothetical protein